MVITLRKENTVEITESKENILNDFETISTQGKIDIFNHFDNNLGGELCELYYKPLDKSLLVFCSHSDRFIIRKCNYFIFTVSCFHFVFFNVIIFNLQIYRFNRSY